MFIITEGANKHVWGNRKEDDFLRFLPVQFGVAKEALTIELIPSELENWLQSGKEVDFSSAGFGQKKEGGSPVGSPVALTPVTWPYDENMNFLGIP